MNTPEFKKAFNLIDKLLSNFNKNKNIKILIELNESEKKEFLELKSIYIKDFKTYINNNLIITGI